MATDFETEMLLVGVADQLTLDASLLKVANSYMPQEKVLEFEKIIARNLELAEQFKEAAKEWEQTESISS